MAGDALGGKPRMTTFFFAHHHNADSSLVWEQGRKYIWGAMRTAVQPPTATAGDQPFEYPVQRAFVEPDWKRLPGYSNVTKEEWESALWQRRHTIKNLKELKAALGSFLT